MYLLRKEVGIKFKMESGEFAVVFALMFFVSLLSPIVAVPPQRRMMTRRKDDNLCDKYFYRHEAYDCLGVTKLVLFAANENRTTRFAKDVELALSGKMDQKMIKDIALFSVAVPVFYTTDAMFAAADEMNRAMEDIIYYPEDFVEHLEYMTKNPDRLIEEITELPFFEIGRQILNAIGPTAIVGVGVEEGYRELGRYDEVHKFTALVTYFKNGGDQIFDEIFDHYVPLWRHFAPDPERIFGKKLFAALCHWARSHLDNLDGTYRKAVDRFWKGNRQYVAMKARETAIFVSNFLKNYFIFKTYCKKHNLMDICDKLQKIMEQFLDFSEEKLRKFNAIWDSVLDWVDRHIFHDDKPESEVFLKRSDVKSESSFKKTFELEHSNNGSYCEGKFVDKKFCYRTADMMRNAIDIPRTVQIVSDAHIIEKILPIFAHFAQSIEIINGICFNILFHTFNRVKWLQNYVQSQSLKQAVFKKLSQIEEFARNPPSFHRMLENVRYWMVVGPVNMIRAFKQALSMTPWTKGFLGHLGEIHHIIVHYLEPAIEVTKQKWRTLDCSTLFPKDVCFAIGKWKGALLRDYHEIIDSFWKKCLPVIHAYYPKVVKMLVNVLETGIFEGYCKEHLPAPLCTKFDDVMLGIKKYAHEELEKGKSIYKKVSHWIVDNFFHDVPKVIAKNHINGH